MLKPGVCPVPTIDSSPGGAHFRDSLLGILVSTHSLREIFSRFVEVLGRVIRFDHCSLYRLLPDDTLKLLFAHASCPEQRLLPGKTIPLSAKHLQLLASGVPYLLADLLEEGAPALPEMLAEEARSCLAVPIHFRGEALGLLGLASRRVGAFRESDISPAQAVAQLLGMVIAHQELADHLQELAAQRSTEAEEALEETRALLEINELLLAQRDMRSTFQRLAEVVEERWACDCCDVFLWDEESGHLLLELPTGADALSSPPIRVPLGRGIVGRAAAERFPIRVANVERDSRYVPFYPGTCAEMAVPICAGDRLLGVINVESPHSDAFSSHDLRLMGSIAQQLSLWLENRLLLAQREKAEREARSSAAGLAQANEELRRALEELEAKRSQLVQAEKLAALGTLVSGAAHELNNPLAVVQGYAELLLNQSLPPALRGRLEMIYQEARRAGLIVESLLHLAQASAVPVEAEPEPCAPAEVLESVLSPRSEALAGQKIRTRVSADSEVLVAADRGKIEQVFLQLLRNAEYALAEAPSKEIVIEIRRRGGRAELRFADSGPGIEPEVLPRVFDPFFTTKPVGAGAGLGLTVCYGIVAACGGSIEAGNRPEGGAVFTLFLPLAESK